MTESFINNPARFPLLSNSEYSVTDLSEEEISLFNIDLEKIITDRRAKNILREMNVEKLSDLLFTKKESLFRRVSFGSITYRRILKSISLCFKNSKLADLSAFEEEVYSGTVKRKSKMVVLEGLMLSRDLTAEEISMLENLEVEAVGLIGRGEGVVKKLKCKTVKNLLECPIVDLRNFKGYGKKSFDRIVERTTLFLEDFLAGEEKYKSIEEVTLFLEKKFIDSGKGVLFQGDKKFLLLEKCGIEGGPYTLEQIATRVGLTRERIRQLIVKELQHIQKMLPLKATLGIEKIVERIEQEHFYLEDIDSRILESKGFVLFQVLLNCIHGQIKLDPKSGMWFLAKKGKILNCIERRFDGAFTSGDLYDEKICDELVLSILKKYRQREEGLSTLVFWAKKNFFKERGGFLFFRRANKASLLSAIVRDQFPDGVFVYKDIEKIKNIIEKKYPGLGFEEMSNRSIEANITRASDIILWDWGVYIHKDNIDVDSSILAEALQWLDKKFKSGSRRVSLWGFFVENAKKCRKKGVPNEHALHTCMRSKYAEGFAFKKSPHVYPKHQKKRLTIEILIEDALIDSDGGVHKSELINRLGVKEYQVDQAISRMENICRDAQGGLYHIESFSASEELKKFFYNKLFEAIEKFTHISVKQIYNDNIISCKKAGIKDDRVLYSILSIYFSDDFSFVRYPYVLEKNHGIEDDGALSLNDIVKDYFIKQKGVVHHKDLHNYFVTERHYNPRRIDAIQYLCDNIVKYSRGAFVSLEQIEWSEGKEAELKRMIEVRYKKNLELFQKPYVSLEELMEEDLPDLDYENNIVWQKTLLRELIDRMEQTLFLGSYREVVIFRDADGGIECLEDVVWYLLKHKYKGAANLKDLESRLHKDQIVKTLQPAMFSKQKVEISGREIFINEMKN